MLELTPEQEQDILKAIPDPKDLKQLLNEEDTERNGETRRIALLLFERDVISVLNRCKTTILKGEPVFIKLEAGEVADKCDIEPPHPEMLRRIAEKIQRVLVEKAYTVSCESKGGSLQEITIQLAPSLK